MVPRQQFQGAVFEEVSRWQVDMPQFEECRFSCKTVHTHYTHTLDDNHRHIYRGTKQAQK